MDDHDYNANDVKDLNEKNLRQNLFLNFLEVPLKSKRRTRKGMYSTFTYGPPGNKVRFILLDTRTFRDKHVIPSVGGVSWLHPFGAVIACITRFFSSVFGFDVDYNGDVLGEEQWHWFEQVLNDTVRNGMILNLISLFHPYKYSVPIHCLKGGLIFRLEYVC